MYCADFDLKKLFPIKNVDTKPGSFRINYSATLAGFKIYLLGGLNENNQPTNALEAFDITTYRWEKLITTGKVPTPRHSHVAEVVRDSLYVIGGTKSNDIFDRECYLSEVFILDLNSLVWTQIALEVTNHYPPPFSCDYSNYSLPTSTQDIEIKLSSNNNYYNNLVGYRFE